MTKIISMTIVLKYFRGLNKSQHRLATAPVLYRGFIYEPRHSWPYQEIWGNRGPMRNVKHLCRQVVVKSETFSSVLIRGICEKHKKQLVRTQALAVSKGNGTGLASITGFELCSSVPGWELIIFGICERFISWLGSCWFLAAARWSRAILQQTMPQGSLS